MPPQIVSLGFFPRLDAVALIPGGAVENDRRKNGENFPKQSSLSEEKHL
jgi:hypothetical protein